MRVDAAKSVARAWVEREASGFSGFQGAYLAGSVNWLPDDAKLSPTSDLDVMIVVDGPDAAAGRRKIVQDGVLLEISTLPLDLVRSPEQVLGDYALAGGFRVPSVIADPTGHLTMLQAEVSRRFAEPAWVRRRCEHAFEKNVRYLDGLRVPRPFHELVIGWAFGASLPTLVPLIAALRNPTVRRRYVAVRELLAEPGRLDLYERLLALLGCAAIERRQVEHHLAALADLYDATVPVMTTPQPFSADISRLSRHVAIDGSRELIDQGLHREAVFWLVVTYGRCMTVLDADASALRSRFEPGYRALLADLGLVERDDFLASAERTKRFLPEVRAVAEEIVAES